MPHRRPRIIAPRLLSGDRRESFGHGLPPSIKQGLRAIARREGQSMSWVLEQVIIRFFNLPMPEYVPRATDVDAHPIVPVKATRASRAAVQ